MGKKSKKGQQHHAAHAHHKAGQGTHQHHKHHEGPLYAKYHHHQPPPPPQQEQQEQENRGNDPGASSPSVESTSRMLPLEMTTTMTTTTSSASGQENYDNDGQRSNDEPGATQQPLHPSNMEQQQSSPYRDKAEEAFQQPRAAMPTEEDAWEDNHPRHSTTTPNMWNLLSHQDWLRPLYLGVGLFLVLFPFWLLDSLKDPLLSVLTNGGLERHQPPAKLWSVGTTLALVCLLEYVTHAKQQQQHHSTLSQTRDAQDVLDHGGVWNAMGTERPALVKTFATPSQQHTDNDVTTNTMQQQQQAAGVSSHIFSSIGVPYCIAFGSFAYLLQFHPSYAAKTTTTLEDGPERMLLRNGSSSFDSWHMLGYILYAAIESYGSLSVAAFWSYTNSTLSLSQAKGYYGPIIALAQLGAIGGSTMVTMNVYDHVTLVVLACLIMVLHICVMNLYTHRFAPSATSSDDDCEPRHEPKHLQQLTWRGRQSAKDRQIPWLSGIYLILRDNYVLLILGASCLYEVSLTCLHYQMTLLGQWNSQQSASSKNGDSDSQDAWGATESFDIVDDQSDAEFTLFMGRYGQLVNVSSLILSSMVFPFLMRRVGLRYTLRLFPTLLLLVNIIAFVALPGNLPVLVASLSFLKAMTYSIHDPSTEILYLPTAPAVKFQAKFWIDVVGSRIAKALGSSINTLAGSVHRSIRVASAPSLCTAILLWLVCFRVGNVFDDKIDTQEERRQQADEDEAYEREPLLTADGEEPSEHEIVFDQHASSPFLQGAEQVESQVV